MAIGTGQMSLDFHAHVLDRSEGNFAETIFKMHIADPAFVPGSTVVVIGANGYMAVEVCDKLLQAGYNVRGTVRDVKKHQEVRATHHPIALAE